MQRITLTLAFMLGILLLARSAPGGTLAAPGPAPVSVRVDPALLPALAAQGIVPLTTLDYGSFLWLHLVPADAKRLPAGVSIAPTTIQLAGHRFDPLLDALPQSGSEPAGLRLIQLNGPTRDAWLDSLAASGRRPLQYVPYQAYLVYQAEELPPATDQFDFVRWSGPLRPEYKIAPDLLARPVSVDGLITNVEMVMYDDGHLAPTLAQMVARGGRLRQSFPAVADGAFVSAIAALPANAIAGLAALPNVLWLGYSSPVPELEDEMANQIVADNAPEGVPTKGYLAWLAQGGYDGSGVIWAMMDTGIDYDHPDLADRLVGGYSFPGACDPPDQPGSDCDGGGHGTHLAGILAGNASLAMTDPEGFLYGLGLAPGASLFAGNPLSGSTWPPAGGWAEISRQALLGGAVGGNNSWTTGEGIHHGYQSSERLHDLMVRDGDFSTRFLAEPYIQVFSAGNFGGAGLTAPKEAKNLIVVGSSENYRAGDIDEISAFSSRGPTEDGRWVPQLVAPGGMIASTRNDLGGICAIPIAGTNARYAYCSGTSMAAAHVSGALSVLTEWWRDRSGGANLSPALALATLVNSATDMDDPDVPNGDEGWGRVNLAAALVPGVPTIYLDQETLFTQTGETWDLAVTVFDPSQPLKVTLAWSDAPGAIGANPALVNDLDLTVSTGSFAYRGNRFAEGWSVPGGIGDNLNNLENAFIAEPSATALISVQASNMAGDGVPYNGDLTDQDFALVCQNCVVFLAVEPAQAAICLPGSATYEIAVGPLADYPGLVDLSVGPTPMGVVAEFSVDPVSSPGASQLEVEADSGALPGRYQLDIGASIPGQSQIVPAQLVLDASAPEPPSLLFPAPEARNVSRQPTFSWGAVPTASTYRLEVATDPAFSEPVLSIGDLTVTEFTPHFLLAADRTHYWRVQAENACGGGSFSQASHFLTTPPPGTCGTGAEPQTLFAADFEDGQEWVHGGWGDTWQISTARAHGGLASYHATDVSSLSDQQLVSPSVLLPVGMAPLSLQFWNYQAIEDNGTFCRDGALVEISEDDGATWLPLEQGLLTDPYDGPIADNWGNPLAGRQAWCGDPQDWLKSVVSLTAYAGKTVRLRFRLGTDVITGREGWYIDDMRVQACPVTDFAVSLTPLSERFNSPGTVVTHTFVVENLGPTDSYDLSLIPGAWESTLLTSTPLTLTYDLTTSLAVTVALPLLTPGDLENSDAFQLTLSSHQAPGLVLTATGRTTAVPVPALALGGDTEQTGITDQVLHYTLWLTNTGIISDAYTIMTRDNRWPVVVQPATFALEPGASHTVQATVMIGFGVDDRAHLEFISSLTNEPSAGVILTSRTHLMYLPGAVFR